jgi:hypothetical protein
MGDPWDIPALPAHGDDSPDVTHIARSKALDAWEWLEIRLSMLDERFRKATQATGRVAKYGAGKIFIRRLETLQKNAQAYFALHPDQQREAILKTFTCHLRKFVLRRHDIAHGVVEAYFSQENSMQEQIECAVLPPVYAIDRQRESNLFPDYAYPSEVLYGFREQFMSLSKEVRAMTDKLFP